eukprot:904348-Pelagomonas_calceolata.AAC.1
MEIKKGIMNDPHTLLWEKQRKNDFRGFIIVKMPSDFSGPPGAFSAQPFDASLLFWGLWDNPRQKFRGKVFPCACGNEGKGEHCMLRYRNVRHFRSRLKSG